MNKTEKVMEKTIKHERDEKDKRSVYFTDISLNFIQGHWKTV